MPSLQKWVRISSATVKECLNYKFSEGGGFELILFCFELYVHKGDSGEDLQLTFLPTMEGLITCKDLRDGAFTVNCLSGRHCI